MQVKGPWGQLKPRQRAMMLLDPTALCVVSCCVHLQMKQHFYRCTLACADHKSTHKHSHAQVQTVPRHHHIAPKNSCTTPPVFPLTRGPMQLRSCQVQALASCPREGRPISVLCPVPSAAQPAACSSHRALELQGCTLGMCSRNTKQNCTSRGPDSCSQSFWMRTMAQRFSFAHKVLQAKLDCNRSAAGSHCSQASTCVSHLKRGSSSHPPPACTWCNSEGWIPGRSP